MKYKILTKNTEHAKAVFRRLVELGYEWRGGGTEECHLDRTHDRGGYILLNQVEANRLSQSGGSGENYREPEYELLTLDDLYGDFGKMNFKTESGYKVEVGSSGAKIGDINFTLKEAIKLGEAAKQFLNKL